MRPNPVMMRLPWMGWLASSSALGGGGLGHCNGARAWLQRQQPARKRCRWPYRPSQRCGRSCWRWSSAISSGVLCWPIPGATPPRRCTTSSGPWMRRTPPSRHAMLVDRVLQTQGKPQRHGSQFSRDAATGHLAMAPVEDLSGLDALRAQAGLMPMADYACVLGASH